MPPTQNDLIARKLGEEVVRLYGTPAYLEQLPASSNSADLSAVQIIGFDRGSRVADLLNGQGWQLDKENFRLLTAFQLLQLGLCKQGLGLIFFPEDMGDADADLFVYQQANEVTETSHSCRRLGLPI